MIQVEQIRNFFPPLIRDNPAHQKYLVKEYIQLLILDYLATTSFIRKMAFIGGTNLRLIKGIDRFSEDLDFDCKDFTREEFTEMTDAILLYLQRFGLNVEARDKISDKLRASRRNIYFPGFFFSFPVPSDEVICAMKISALLSRSKGRDFYDSMFLLGQTTPDYNFLAARNGIHNLSELKSALTSLFAKINLSQKARDFEHLLFEKRNSERILRFKEFVAEL